MFKKIIGAMTKPKSLEFDFLGIGWCFSNVEKDGRLRFCRYKQNWLGVWKSDTEWLVIRPEKKLYYFDIKK